MNKLNYKLDIQKFGDVLTFDEILEDKTYQSEFDKRVTKAIQTATENHKADIEKYKAKADEADEWRTKYETLEADFKAKEDKYNEKLGEVTKTTYIDKAVLKSGTIDEVSVKAHLQGFLKDAKFEDGKIEGLDEELSKLQEEKAYLWEKPKATGTGHGSPKKDLTEEERVRRAVGLK